MRMGRGGGEGREGGRSWCRKRTIKYPLFESRFFRDGNRSEKDIFQKESIDRRGWKWERCGISFDLGTISQILLAFSAVNIFFFSSLRYLWQKFSFNVVVFEWQNDITALYHTFLYDDPSWLLFLSHWSYCNFIVLFSTNSAANYLFVWSNLHSFERNILNFSW